MFQRRVRPPSSGCWWWRSYALLKCRSTSRLNGALSQRAEVWVGALRLIGLFLLKGLHSSWWLSYIFLLHQVLLWWSTLRGWDGQCMYHAWRSFSLKAWKDLKRSWFWGFGLDLCGSGYGSVAGYSEHSYEPTDSTKGGSFWPAVPLLAFQEGLYFWSPYKSYGLYTRLS
jgi:hypothetical protein